MQVNSAIFLVVFKTSEQMYLVELYCMFVTVASQEIVIALFFKPFPIKHRIYHSMT